MRDVEIQTRTAAASRKDIHKRRIIAVKHFLLVAGPRTLFLTRKTHTGIQDILKRKLSKSIFSIDCLVLLLNSGFCNGTSP
jgi:hypothetical protein